MLQAEMVVGQEGSCTYHGQAYFDTSVLLPDTPVVSATLSLYSPDQSGPSAITVYSDTAPTDYWPTWQSAAPLVTGTGGISPTSAGDHWQRWDVTAFVRQWVAKARTNAGLTLVSSGAPVRLASLQGPAEAGTAYAPYLDIVYGPRPSVSPLYSDVASPAGTAAQAARLRPHFNDNAISIFGLSGSLGTCANGASSCTECPSGSTFCSATCQQGYTCHEMSLDQAVGFTAQYVRFGATLECPVEHPSNRGWWTTSDENPMRDQNGNVITHGGKRYDADPNDIGSVYDLMLKAYLDHLTPIVLLQQDDACPGYLELPQRWWGQVQDFISQMSSTVFNQLASSGNMTYFEITNEIDNDPKYNYGHSIPNSSYSFAAIFAAAAAGLQFAIDHRKGDTGAHYRILTGGMLHPTATRSQVPDGDNGYCTDNLGIPYNPNHTLNIDLASAAISAAQGFPAPFHVDSSRLGYAIHPYAYTTNESGYWRNFYNSQIGSNHYIGSCFDLGTTITTWAATGIPVIFTEDNWFDDPVHNTLCARPTSAAECEGSYLIDLSTWLGWHPSSTNSYNNQSSSPIRIAWFRAKMDPDNRQLGLYDTNLHDRTFTIPVTGIYCPSDGVINGSLVNDFSFVTLGARCY